MLLHAVILAISNPHHRSKLTYNRAHAMLPALGKPLVTRIMDRLYRIGIREYTVIVGASEGAVVSYLNANWMPDVKINLMIWFEHDNLLRMFKNIAEQHQQPFIVCSYNSFTHHNFPERLLKLHQTNTDALIFSGAHNTLSSSYNHDYGVVENQHVVEITDDATREHELYKLTDLFVCGQQMVDYLRYVSVEPTQISLDFMDIARKYIQIGNTGLIAESNWILQVEADRDLLTLNTYLLKEGNDAHILSEVPYTVNIIPPVRIDPHVNVGQGAVIGPNVYLERGCSVGHDVVIRDSLVLTKGTIPPKTRLTNNIFTTRGKILD
ncbi:MAG: hypothetical protein Kow00117_12400 [Phototrophicales bacterium]|nr:MAG: NDP-sugar synthase [Chloroflexota bacterium]